jgi:hypothetical protein
MANKKYIDENFYLEGLFKIGFLKSITDYDYIENRILTYFTLEYIEQYSGIGCKKETELKAENIFSDN